MPAIILSDNGATSGSAGLKTSGGNDGVLQLQTTTSGGTPTTAISISNTQVVTYTNQPTYTGGTANGVLYLNGSKAVTSGTALTFDGTNLGLGVTPSAWGGNVVGTLELKKGVYFASNSAIAAGYLGTNNYSTDGGATWKYKISTYAEQYIQYNGQHIWLNAGSGTADSTISFAQAMTLDASGNLMIGTTTQAGRVAIKQTTTNWYDGVRVFNSSSNTWTGIGNTGSLAVVSSSYDNTGSYLPLAFYTSDTERMRIDATGAALFGGSTAFAYTSNLGSILLSNGFTDTPNIQFLTGANKNWAIDSWNSSSGASNQFLRIVRDINESTGKLLYTFSEAGTITLGNVNTGASPINNGTGIAFPATQSSSSDANTLDDYEEGSWTPSLRDGGTNRSPSYAYGPSGTYVKIGRFVFVRWGFKLTSKGAGAGSGEIQIYGLPFTPTNTGSYQEENVSVATGILNTAVNASRARMVVSTSAYLFGRVADNADTQWTYNDLTDTSWIIGEVCYIATA